MVEKYGLNKKQAKKLLELNARYAGKMSPMEGCDRCFNKGKRPDDGSQPPLLRDSMPRPPRPDSEAMQAEHKEMQENMAAYRSELKEIMTEEQNRYNTAMVVVPVLVSKSELNRQRKPNNGTN